MIRRPPRSTLFPSRRSSDLGGRCQTGISKVPARSTGRLQPPRSAPAELDVARGLPGDLAPEELLDDGERHVDRSEEHTSELQSHVNLVCRLLLEKKKKTKNR